MKAGIDSQYYVWKAAHEKNKLSSTLHSFTKVRDWFFLVYGECMIPKCFQYTSVCTSLINNHHLNVSLTSIQVNLLVLP